MENIELTNFNQILNKYADASVKILKQELQKHNRVASGKLLNSITTKIQHNDTEITVTINHEDYLKWVCEGRKPTQGGTSREPLKDKIKLWIEQKHILPRPDNLGKVPTQDQLAYLIARKIHREGYAGSDDLNETIEQVNTEYFPELVEALEKDLKNYYSIEINTVVNNIFK